MRGAIDDHAGLTTIMLVSSYCDAATQRRLTLLETTRMSHALLRVLPLRHTFIARRVWVSWHRHVLRRRRARTYVVSFRRRLHTMDEPIASFVH
jgi:hypothetical protein